MIKSYLIKAILILNALVLLILCSNKISSSGETLQNIKVSFNFVEPELTDFGKNICFTRLETNTNCLLGSINKLILLDDKIFILNGKGQKGLYIFSKSTGKFLFKIANNGNGPGEFTEPWDFNIINGQIVIFDAHSDKFLKYDISGKFISAENTPLSIMRFESMANGDLICLNELMGGIDNVFYGSKISVLRNNKISGQYYKRSFPDGNFTLFTAFSKFQSVVNYFELFNDTIYKYDNDFRPAYLVDFGKYSIPKEVLAKPFNERLEKLNKNPELYAVLINMCEFDKYIVLTFNHDSAPRTSFISKKDKRSVSCKYLRWSEKNVKIPGFNFKANENYAVSIIYPEKLVRINASKPDGIGSPGQLDNPVLVFTDFN
jgi:hypothetical protein